MLAWIMDVKWWWWWCWCNDSAWISIATHFTCHWPLFPSQVIFPHGWSMSGHWLETKDIVYTNIDYSYVKVCSWVVRVFNLQSWGCKFNIPMACCVSDQETLFHVALVYLAKISEGHPLSHSGHAKFPWELYERYICLWSTWPLAC